MTWDKETPAEIAERERKEKKHGGPTSRELADKSFEEAFGIKDEYFTQKDSLSVVKSALKKANLHWELAQDNYTINGIKPKEHYKGKIGMCSKCKEMCFVDDSCCGVSVIVEGEVVSAE